ncbi:MAG: hypothetical protein QM820_03865 [Minicystis sp.]
MKRAFLGWLLAATIAGCGGKVVVDVGATTTGGGGTGGGAPVTICGGKQGLPCAADEFCAFDPAGSCGNFDLTGVCTPKPGGCPADCPGVCGCDGQFYCNACGAHAAGTDVSAGPCTEFPDAGPPPVDAYAAFSLPTSAPRYVITKADHALDRCVFIFVVGFQTGAFPGIDVTMNWQAERIGVTPHASDCALGGGLWPAPPEMVTTDTAKGIIKQDSTSFPCSVSVDVAIAFPPGSPAWVPAQVSMTADGIPVQDAGCGGE